MHSDAADGPTTKRLHEPVPAHSQAATDALPPFEAHANAPVRSRIRVQQADFDVGSELAALRADNGGVGAVCSFVGTVRAAPDGGLLAMEIEHYPGMTERAIQAMVAAAHKRFSICGAVVIHRIGQLHVQDQIVLVAVTAVHRGQSFQACEFLMDYLKTSAPFWKKEHTALGAHWVDARESDDAALARWGIPAGNR